MTYDVGHLTPNWYFHRFLNRSNDFCRIVGAVLLQDMRTRFGRSQISYLIAIAWPLSHLSFITLAYLLKVEIAPVGDSPTIFISTGIVPYILCLYPARMVAVAIMQNRQLLNIPVIRPLHLIISRCILETLNAFVVLALFVLTIYIFDVDVLPDNTIEAAAAIGAAVFLGVGLGFFNVVMCALLGNFFLLFFIFTMIMLYIFSGVYIPNSALPDAAREYMLFNPLLNLVEWLRSAYYASYDTDLINKRMVIGVAAVSLALGLLGERFLRGKFFS